MSDDVTSSSSNGSGSSRQRKFVHPLGEGCLVLDCNKCKEHQSKDCNRDMRVLDVDGHSIFSTTIREDVQWGHLLEWDLGKGILGQIIKQIKLQPLEQPNQGSVQQGSKAQIARGSKYADVCER